MRYADVHHRFQCGIAPAAISYGKGVRPATYPAVGLGIEGLTGCGSPTGLRTAPVPPQPTCFGCIGKERQAQQGHDQRMHPPSHGTPRHRGDFRAWRPSRCPNPYANWGCVRQQTAALVACLKSSRVPKIWSLTENLVARQKAEGRGRLLCHGLPVYRTCCPPANGVSTCETDADRASPCRHCWRRVRAFQGSGPTLLVWHLRRDAETGRMSVKVNSSRRPVVLQMNHCTTIQPLPPS